MEQKGFKQLTNQEMAKTYGGFWGALATFIPAAITSIAQMIASMKMLGSPSGSYKSKGLEAHWTESKSSGKTTHDKPVVNKTVFFAY